MDRELAAQLRRIHRDVDAGGSRPSYAGRKKELADAKGERLNH